MKMNNKATNLVSQILTNKGKLHEVIRDTMMHEMRSVALKLIYSFFYEEVNSLCGKAFSRKKKHTVP